MLFLVCHHVIVEAQIYKINLTCSGQLVMYELAVILTKPDIFGSSTKIQLYSNYMYNQTP